MTTDRDDKARSLSRLANEASGVSNRDRLAQFLVDYLKRHAPALGIELVRGPIVAQSDKVIVALFENGKDVLIRMEVER